MAEYRNTSTFAMKTGSVLSSALLFAVVLTGCGAFQLTTGLYNGTTVKVCQGGNLFLDWHATLDQGETIVDIRWMHDGKGDLIAMYASNNFAAMPHYVGRVQHVPLGGLILKSVTSSDTGHFIADMFIRDATDHITHYHLTASLEVAIDPPQTADGSLHAWLSPAAVYDNSTAQWSVVLSCGTFTQTGNPPVTVEWTTPSGTKVASSVFDGSAFTLQLPTPPSGGTYTCRVKSDSLASACLPDGSPVLTSASVTVDRTEVRLTLLEAQQKALKADNEHLKQPQTGNCSHVISSLQQGHDSLVSSLANLTNENSVLKDRVLVLETALAQNQANVTAQMADLQNQVVTADNILHQTTANLTSDITYLLQDNTDIKLHLTDLENGVTENVENLTKLTNSLHQCCSDLDQRVQILESGSASVNLTAVMTYIGDLQVGQDNLTDQQTNMSATLRTLETTLQSDNHNLTQHVQDLVDSNTQLTDHVTQIIDADTVLTTMVQNIITDSANLAAQVHTLEATVHGDTANLTERMDNLETAQIVSCQDLNMQVQRGLEAT
ncbi:hypothetical protein BaRGS_00020747 [Batillaria attramentaria]|uniref:Ig-like domain-containing protein n=1 Tax=Batillaria attramentaria TaxID=370345 RepID=A0ABD0KLP3_9CAEN